MIQRDTKAGRKEYPEKNERPTLRSQCSQVGRPCPFVGCQYHLYLDVNQETGSIKFNFPNDEPMDLLETCALDVATRGEHTLLEVGSLLNMSRERIRQLEEAIHLATKEDPELKDE